MARARTEKLIAKILNSGKKKRSSTSANAIKKPWRHQSKPSPAVEANMSLTEKARRSAARAERRQQKSSLNTDLENIRAEMRRHAEALREKYGMNTVDWFYKTIMQQTGKASFKRKPSLWNAWQRGELARRNAARSEGTPRLKLSDVKTELSTSWNTMTNSEKVAATKDYLPELEEARENRKFIKHNTEMAAHSDGQKTLATVQVILQSLAERCGIKTMVVAVRERATQLFSPWMFSTSPRLPHFFELILKTSIQEIMCRLEGYSVSGVEGLVDDHIRQTKDLKAYLVELIRQKLDVLIKEKRLEPIPRIFYINFEKNMTLPHHVELKGWPLKELCCPSDIKSRTEVELVVQGLQNGTTYWKYLEGEDWKAWQTTYFGRVTGSSPTVPPTPDIERASSETSEETVVASTPSSTAAASESGPPEGPSSTTESPNTSAAPPTEPVHSPAPMPSPPSTTAGDGSANKRPSGDSVEQQPTSTKKRRQAAPDPFTQFINLGVEGAPVAVKTTTRKPRKKKTDNPPTTSESSSAPKGTGSKSKAKSKSKSKSNKGDTPEAASSAASAPTTASTPLPATATTATPTAAPAATAPAPTILPTLTTAPTSMPMPALPSTSVPMPVTMPGPAIAAPIPGSVA
ncbi:hypothetical protein EVJ58_g718 [Rhodofomes roseus]|uniref:Uncharacterized protein n=1 Tax=Rhodofomes roseus TaxID=34475 RepID=A0A4Y9Z307_9APHY|nr:hypothetical protein EVJ58_g718 [Rhodofomes roseus]